MANEGGVLLYGIGEDEYKRLTVDAPIELKGAGERVSSIVFTTISPPPQIEILPFERADMPGFGYLAVVVPLSPHAPHMVTVDKDHRFYGRSTLGNVPLTEGTVAQFYARRQV